MHRRTLTKPDGRSLILYAREPILGDVEAPVPADELAAAATPLLRWHPLRGE
jgi:UDPglucose--hexose-1-phosphate uridylyltransferase